MSRKLRVAIISTAIWGLYDTRRDRAGAQGYAPGGAEIQLRYLGEEMVRRRLAEVSFVTGDFGQPATVDVDGVSLVRGPKPPFGQPLPQVLWGTFILFRTLLRLKPDVIVDRTASPRVGFLAAYSILFRTPFAFMTSSEPNCDGGYEKRAGALFGRLYRFGVRRANLVLAQSRGHRDLLRHHYSRDARVQPNVLPIHPCSRSNPAEHVLWVGRCTAIKRPLLFVRLARELPGIPFVMIAPPVPTETALHEDVLRAARDVPNLRVLGEVPFADVQPWYDRARMFVNTSVQEGFPNTFLQAAQAGVPVVSLNVDPDGVVESHGWGFHARDEWQPFRDAVNRIAVEPAERERMGDAAYRYLVAHHGLERGARRLARYLSRLAAGFRKR